MDKYTDNSLVEPMDAVILLNDNYANAGLKKGFEDTRGTLFFSIANLIKEKAEAEAKKHLKKFDEEPELEIMNGRYGPYIDYKGSNYKIPKDIVPEDLNLDACMEIIKLQSEKAASAPAKPKRGKYTKKKA